MSTAVHAAYCPACGRVAPGWGPRSRSGVCKACQPRHQCFACGAYSAEPVRGKHCRACCQGLRCFYQALAWLRPCCQPLPAVVVEARVRCYRERAARRLPLFEEGGAR